MIIGDPEVIDVPCVNFWTEVGGNLPTMDLYHSTCLSFCTRAYYKWKNCKASYDIVCRWEEYGKRRFISTQVSVCSSPYAGMCHFLSALVRQIPSAQRRAGRAGGTNSMVWYGTMEESRKARYYGRILGKF